MQADGPRLPGRAQAMPSPSRLKKIPSPRQSSTWRLNRGTNTPSTSDITSCPQCLWWRRCRYPLLSTACLSSPFIYKSLLIWRVGQQLEQLLLHLLLQGLQGLLTLQEHLQMVGHLHLGAAATAGRHGTADRC